MEDLDLIVFKLRTQKIWVFVVFVVFFVFFFRDVIAVFWVIVTLIIILEHVS